MERAIPLIHDMEDLKILGIRDPASVALWYNPLTRVAMDIPGPVHTRSCKQKPYWAFDGPWIPLSKMYPGS
jgi:hypothetical protein